MKPFRWHRAARAEVQIAVAHYEGERKGLGREFREDLEAALGRIRRNPKAFSFYDATVIRKCLLHRFPYTVFFEELDTVIWVRAVAHQKRKPGYWLDRTPD